MRHAYLYNIAINGLKLPTAKKGKVGLFGDAAKSKDVADMNKKFDYRSKRILEALKDGQQADELKAALQKMPEDGYSINDLVKDSNFLATGVDFMA